MTDWTFEQAKAGGDLDTAVSALEQAAYMRGRMEERERCAKIVEQTLREMHLEDRQWARAAILFAARAVRRGRHLTAKEKLENFMKAMAETDEDEA